MLARIFALFVAVMLMTASAAELQAAPEAATQIDDAPDLAMPHGPSPVAAAAPRGPEQPRIEAAPAWARGRMHAVLIFRPPR